jgi:hypothetical protein
VYVTGAVKFCAAPESMSTVAESEMVKLGTSAVTFVLNGTVTSIVWVAGLITPTAAGEVMEKAVIAFAFDRADAVSADEIPSSAVTTIKKVERLAITLGFAII